MTEVNQETTPEEIERRNQARIEAMLASGELPRPGDFIAHKLSPTVCGIVVRPVAYPLGKQRQIPGWFIRLASGTETWIDQENILFIAPREWGEEEEKRG